MLKISNADEGRAVGLRVGEDASVVDSGPWRVLESQQTDPRSQRFGGLVMMTDGLEQKAPINPGKQTPGQRFKGPSVVVGIVVVAFGVVVIGLGVVVREFEGRLVVPF